MNQGSESPVHKETALSGDKPSTDSSPGPRDDCAEWVVQFSIDTLPEGMSKTRWKKKLKHQKKLKKWEKMKQESKVRRKERQSQLKKERQALGGLPPPKKTRLEDGGSSKISQRGSYKKMSDEGASSVRVAVDCSFEQLTSAKDQLKLIKQLQRCYAANRRSVAPLQIHYRSEDFLEVFGKENVVYLLAESTNVLNELDPSKAYIIGGLVDHNHHKVHCYQVAEEKGLAHARLPISEYIRMSGRKVLTINHVPESLCPIPQEQGQTTT
ncbi:tRNA methyltransferase 10 homolog A-like isoform X5 [Halichondria panicea]|uniref:tRNA methyltransferase 10 homolog A-like isoform X5 n=1 Tax=Halichondria panicea TaxID=6063 RepID=UPI00312B4C52